MRGHDAQWVYKALDCLFGFCYLHVVNASRKPEKDQEHDWDWSIGRYHGLHYTTFGSVNLLAGYALETLIKGCLDQAGLTPKEYRGHNLPRLAETLATKWDLTLTAQQLEFLGRMEGIVVWRGRYPMSKNPDEEVKTNISLGGQLLDEMKGYGISSSTNSRDAMNSSVRSQLDSILIRTPIGSCRSVVSKKYTRLQNSESKRSGMQSKPRSQAPNGTRTENGSVRKGCVK